MSLSDGTPTVGVVVVDVLLVQWHVEGRGGWGVFDSLNWCERYYREGLEFVTRRHIRREGLYG